MRQFLLMTGVAAAFVLGGCGDKDSSEAGEGAGGAVGLPPKAEPDTVESLYEEMEDQLDSFAEALREVRESGTPEEFASQVEIVTAEMKAISSRLLDLEVPSDEVKQRLSARRKAREEEMQKSFGNLELFLSGLEPEVRASVADSLKTFMTRMAELEDDVFSQYFDAEEPPDAPAPPPAPE